jgi:hypothetical protein
MIACAPYIWQAVYREAAAATIKRICEPHGIMLRIWSEFRWFQETFERRGQSEAEALASIQRFWDLPRNSEQPAARIGAYLFAAFARRVVGGQRKFTRGLLNAIRAIFAYAPYVDHSLRPFAAMADLSRMRSRADGLLSARSGRSRWYPICGFPQKGGH